MIKAKNGQKSRRENEMHETKTKSATAEEQTYCKEFGCSACRCSAAEKVKMTRRRRAGERGRESETRRRKKRKNARIKFKLKANISDTLFLCRKFILVDRIHLYTTLLTILSHTHKQARALARTHTHTNTKTPYNEKC